MPVYRLPDHYNIFPFPLEADDSGVLAVGGDLSPGRLKVAYAFGIFPWFNAEDPILWWFPNPRCVLYPKDFKISKSLRATLTKSVYSVTMDKAFQQVIEHCRTIRRKDQVSTWIQPGMLDAYCVLHREGYAHSVEVWNGGRLVGGLYGVAMGKLFFGESMFSIETDASKVGLAYLVETLRQRGFWLIDCQQDTPHMRSLGATVIDHEVFYEIIQRNQIECLAHGAQRIIL